MSIKSFLVFSDSGTLRFAYCRFDNICLNFRFLALRQPMPSQKMFVTLSSLVPHLGHSLYFAAWHKSSRNQATPMPSMITSWEGNLKRIMQVVALSTLRPPTRPPHP